MNKLKKQTMLQSISTKALAAAFATTLGAAFASAPSLAQTADDADSVDETRELNKVTVTGRLRGEGEALQDVPVAVTVVSAESLANIASVTIEDLEAFAPNLVIQNNGSGSGIANMSLRGVAFSDAEKAQEATVGVVIDGVFNAQTGALLSNTFDFEQVEVFRGPQGTLFGRNTIGGVVNIQRTRPTGEFGVRAEGTFGDNGRQEFNGVLNFGLGERAALKIFANDAQYDGFLFNETLQQKTGSRNSQNIGATLLLNPTDNLEILLTAEQLELDGDNDRASASVTSEDFVCALGAGAAGQCDLDLSSSDVYTTYSETLSEYEFEGQMYNGQINLDLGDLKVTSITAYSESEEDSIVDFDATSVPFFVSERPQDYEQFSQEIRLAGDFTDRLSGVLGLFYLDNEVQLEENVRVFGGSSPASTSHKLETKAIFGDFDFVLTDQLTLGFGGRYTEDSKDFVRTIAAGSFPGSDTWSRFTPRLSLDFKVNEDVLLYGSYTQGFRGGGFNLRADRAETAQTTFDEEIVDSFEIGAKTQFADGRGTFNVAAFATQYKDRQFSRIIELPGSASAQETVTDNVGESEINGIEVDASFDVNEFLTISGSLGLLDADNTVFPVSISATVTEDASARPVSRAPEMTYSLRGDVNYPLANGSINANLLLSGSSEYFTSTRRRSGQTDYGVLHPNAEIDPITNLSGSIGYSFELENGNEVYIRGFGRNLLDDEGVGSNVPIAGLFTFGIVRAPQEFGITIGGRF